MKRIVLAMLLACFLAFPAGAFACDLFLEAPGKEIILGSGKAAPVMLNDNHDCNEYYRSTTVGATNYWSCSANCPGDILPGFTCSLGHRELEPVWDLNYVGGTVTGENNLLKLDVRITPDGIQRRAKLSITSNRNNVRVWPSAHKGVKNDIIQFTHKPSDPPDTYSCEEFPVPMNGNPVSFYVEGIKIDPADAGTKFVAEIVGMPATKKELTVHVVSLVEKQAVSIPTGGTVDERRVVYNKGTINYEVKGGSAFSGKIRWKESHAASPLSGNTDINITYSNAATSGNNIQVSEDAIAANRRFMSTVTAEIHNGAPTPVVVLPLKREVRVAQDDYHGTSVVTPPGYNETIFRRAQVAVMALLPMVELLPNNTLTPPDATPFSAAWFDKNYGTAMVAAIAGGTAKPNQAIQYGAWFTSTPFLLNEPGGVVFDNRERGALNRIYCVLLFKSIYDLFKNLEDVTAVADHEARHAWQFLWMRPSGPGSPNSGAKQEWVDLERDALAQRNLFMEADAYNIGLENLGVTWKFIALIGPINFRGNYINALNAYDGVINAGTNSGLEAAMKKILQDVYKDVPFKEMKYRPGIPGDPGLPLQYNWIIRAPR